MHAKVLYNLCEWPTRKGSRLAVIGIANTLDLPERLMPRVASRLGSRRVVFQPYKRDQLVTIVQQRLADAGVAESFEKSAISYAAGKVRGSHWFRRPQQVDWAIFAHLIWIRISDRS